MNQINLKDFPSVARKAATEGIVLLKNENNVLPFRTNETVALFGRSQINYYRSGTGSGGAVNSAYVVNALEGLSNKDIILNQELVDAYKAFIEENPFDNGGGGWAQEPWFQKEMPLSDAFVSSIKETSDKAVIIIGRTAGEDKDNEALPGGYYLTEDEIKMIDMVTKHFDDVVMVLNVGNIIDMKKINEYENKIKTILYAWHGGMEGGNALADILVGDVTPSGKLAGTIAKNISDYPSNKNFGDDNRNYYEEDIYVGYRYFETFDQEAVLYPFGYGLSYTNFTWELVDEEVTSEEITLKIRVQNKGDITGKEVVQVYVEAPQGKLGKPRYELKAFQKTRELLPNDYQHVTITIKKSSLASYDDGGYTGFKSAYVLEEGLYKIHFGSHVRDLRVGAVFTQRETVCIEQLSETLAPTRSLKRMVPGKLLDNGNYKVTYKEVPRRSIDLEERILSNLPKEVPFKGDLGIQLLDVYNNKFTLDEFISQLTVDELILIVRGEGMSHPLVTPGTAAAFGGIYDELRYYGIPTACAADGPSGLRMDSGHKATQMPIGSLLACTWNYPLMETLYTYEGKELYENNVDTLLGPGLNIHRHPLCGRNFEYFSEDPYLTGQFSKAAIIGMKNGGSEGTLKHYAANDQEKRRHHIDAVASERALREIHLKGFEIAVKEANAKSIMTSYNPINGHWAASNYDLNTTILRQEWGYDGMVMTDWWAMMNHNVVADEASRKHSSYMIRSQNDLYMVFPNFMAKQNAIGDNLKESIENKSLTIGELQRSVKNILSFILNSPSLHREMKTIEVQSIEPTSYEGEVVDIHEKLPFNTKLDATQWLDVKEPQTFSVSIDLRYDQSSLAQSVVNVILNGETIYSLQMNGNENKWTNKHITQVKLSKGQYHLELKFSRPGLEVGTVKFIQV